MSLNRAQCIREFLRKWKLATSEQLRTLAIEDGELSPERFRHLLWRLRKARALFSLRMGYKTVHFDSQLQSRYEYLKKLSPGLLDSVRSRFGIDHHIETINVAFLLENVLPRVQIKANLFSEHVSTTSIRGATKERIHAPDLVCELPDSSERRLVYIEVERSLKGAARYFEKWRAYEVDPNVSACLYYVLEGEVSLRLERLMREFFGRSFGNQEFRLGIVSSGAIERFGGNAVVQWFSMGRESKETLSSLVKEGRGRREICV